MTHDDKDIDAGYHTLMVGTDIATEQLRSRSDALRGRAQGVIIGSPIAFGWAFYAATGVTSVFQYVIVAVAAGVSLSLVIAGAAMNRLARSLPRGTPAQTLAKRRVWWWFWLNTLAEIILLNVAVGFLAAPDLRIYWIPAISAVVGLHFWPMAIFFRVRSYWWVGGAMLASAAAVAMAAARFPDNGSALIHGEALINALILWSALAAGAAFALTRSRRSLA